MREVEAAVARSDDVLWYDRPAPQFREAVPIGGGTIGAMVYGGVAEERLSLNHKQLWRATKRDVPVAKTADRLPEIRALFLEGRVREGAELARQVLSGTPGGVDPYQPFCDLRIRGEYGDPTDYRQSLDMAAGVHETRFTSGGVTYWRTALASIPDQVVVVDLTASEPGSVSCTVQLSRVEDPECVLDLGSDGTELRLTGAFPEGVAFAALADLRTEGGTVQLRPGEATAEVVGADRLTVVVALGVAGHGTAADALGLARRALDAAPTQPASLAARHMAAHRQLYERCSLDLGVPESAMPTNRRREALHEGPDPALLAQFFQFGRYLLIASSQPGDPLPANLQGIWNEDLRPAWQSDLHLDVNLEMNYWPAEVTGLSECTAPLFDFIDSMVPAGKAAARDLWGAEGVFLPITTSGWGTCTLNEPGWDIWVGAASWIAMHYWQHWEYTGDTEFLRRRAYPFLKECARFWETFLVRDADGYLVSIPSQSPENTVVGNVSPVSLVVSATMDVALARDVLERALQAREVLGVDPELESVWRDMLASLPPFRIGRHGQLQEWLEDYEEAEPGHRHYSHLVGLYPGDLITPEGTPELAQAARVSLERRLAHGGGHTGWSRAWTAALFARLGDGDAAVEHLNQLVAEQCSTSLLDLHPPMIFQIDGNFGATAAIAEMLIQSHDGVIRVLPALPAAWPSGSFRGLRARGGFVVDAAWSTGRPTEVRITGPSGTRFRVRILGQPEIEATVPDGGVWTWSPP